MSSQLLSLALKNFHVLVLLYFCSPGLAEMDLSFLNTFVLYSPTPGFAIAFSRSFLSVESHLSFKVQPECGWLHGAFWDLLLPKGFLLEILLNFIYTQLWALSRYCDPRGDFDLCGDQGPVLYIFMPPCR